MSQDKKILPPEDGGYDPEVGVLDAENSPPAFHAEGHPTEEVENEELAHLLADGDVIAQESMGERKIISVAPVDEERQFAVMIDGKELKPDAPREALQEAGDLFGAYDLAVDEYKEGNKKKWAISQALTFKGIDMRRTIPSVRLSAAREVYGFLINKGQMDRFTLLETAYTAPEKAALKNPVFFHRNRGYEA